MPFKALQTILIPLLILKQAAAESAHNPYEFVLREGVPVFASLSYSSHHVDHKLLIVCSRIQIVLNILILIHRAKR